VRWGKRLYLVPKDGGADFCDDFNLGRLAHSPGFGSSYIRGDDATEPVLGLPSVPAEWRWMLLEKPVQGKVVARLDDERARVDVGSAAGVWNGMRLCAEAGGSGFTEVVEVDRTSCVVRGDKAIGASWQIDQRVSSREPVASRE
jgi:hypothetical protein